jgi:hypothetical protein
MMTQWVPAGRTLMRWSVEPFVHSNLNGAVPFGWANKITSPEEVRSTLISTAHRSCPSAVRDDKAINSKLKNNPVTDLVMSVIVRDLIKCYTYYTKLEEIRLVY